MEGTLAVEQWRIVFGLLEEEKVASGIELKQRGKSGDENEFFKPSQVLQKHKENFQGQILTSSSQNMWRVQFSKSHYKCNIWGF